MNQNRDKLLGALIGLARASESKELSDSAGEAIVDGLALAFSEFGGSSNPVTACAGDMLETDTPDTITAEAIHTMIERLHHEKRLMAPDCAACQYPCGRTFDYDMEEIYGASEALRSAKLLLFSKLGQLAHTSGANELKENRQFLSDALFQISCTYAADQLTDWIARAENGSIF